jgi:hypothetical protein
LDLLGNLKVILEARETIEPEEQELIMPLSPLYLEKLQAAEQAGEVRHAQAQTVRPLNRRVGNVSTDILARVKVLSLLAGAGTTSIGFEFGIAAHFTALVLALSVVQVEKVAYTIDRSRRYSLTMEAKTNNK